MTTALPATADMPRDPETGLILPLSRYLGSPDLRKHRAMVAVELEVMAKKMDRFGWESDRNSPAHDRLVTDWMDALSNYPLEEVQSACREWVLKSPRKMPNEGDIASLIQSARRKSVESFKASQTRPMTREEREAMAAQQAKAREINPERKAQAEAILSELGIKKIGDVK